MNERQRLTQVCVLLVCFAGAKRASHVRSEFGKGVRSSGGTLLDEAVRRVSHKGEAMVYDPRRSMAGGLTSALTWGVFGLLASGGSWKSLVIWSLIGALCGGLYDYYTEHLLSKSQLKRIGERLGPGSSALAIWAEAADPEQLLSATAPLQPATSSVAEIADDLSAKVFAGAATRVESFSTGAGESRPPASTSLLSMLLRAVRQTPREEGNEGQETAEVAADAARGQPQAHVRGRHTAVVPGRVLPRRSRPLIHLHNAAWVTVLIVIGFNLVQNIFLEIPMLAFKIWPSETPAAIESAKAWGARHAREYGAWALAILGAALAVISFIGLLSR